MPSRDEKLINLAEIKIALLGFGLENQALLRYLLEKKIPCQIFICDARPEVKKLIRAAAQMKVGWRLGKHYDKNLGQFNLIFRSPGYPLYSRNLARARRVGAEISSPMRLFFDLCPSRNIIAVSGSKGKGTTAALIYYILKQSGKLAWLGGNIGVAPFSFLAKIKKGDWLVLELSSFQMEDLVFSPRIAVMTNFFPEHLAPADPNNPNYHLSLAEYWAAKSKIFKYQKRPDWLIINQKLASQRKIKTRAKIIKFIRSDLASNLIGEHNRENIAAAVETAKTIGIRSNLIKQAVARFKGLEHRLEFVRAIKGVKYYNDSFATTPEAALTAIKSFSQPVILLAGGAEKKSDFESLARAIKQWVKMVILLDGLASPRLKRELLRQGLPAAKIKSAASMRAAVGLAARAAAKNEVVLLSPACASFGMFQNYKERGRLFKEQVKELK